MSKLIVRIIKKPKPKMPVMIGGIPDSGYVAKLVMDHMVKELKAELFGEIYSYGFPPQVLIRKDGTAELIKNEFYFWRGQEGAKDLIMFTGDAQPISPEAAYTICDRALSLARGMGSKLVYTVGASITGTFVSKPRVFGTATDTGLLPELERHGVITMNQGNITWMNGLLMGLTKLKNMKGIFLSGETSGYIVDGKAAQALLEALTRILNIKLDITALEERASETEKVIRMIEAQRRTFERAARPEAPSEPYR